LKSLGLTEEELDPMPPEKREQVEKGMGERMREMIAMQNGQAPGRQEDPTQAGAALNAWMCARRASFSALPGDDALG
ncbi:hypothetical protein ACPTH5_31515, partial [Pseudomonas aeruginosa]